MPTPVDVGPLPPPWQAYKSRTHGKVYFFNPKTGETTYNRPAMPAASTASTGLAPPSQLISQGGGGHSSSGRTVVPSSSGISFDKTTAEGYQFQDAGIEGRKSKQGAHAFYFNNWAKAVIINEYASHANAVLDLACGKLGDLRKWRHVQRYVGIDISDAQINDAVARFQGAGGPFEAKFMRGDLGAIDLARSGAMEPDEKFDAISIQFALHYLFQSEKTALQFFGNIAGRLQPGGVFLGTIPDDNVMVRRIRNLKPSETTFGNSLYRVTVDDTTKKHVHALHKNPYGCVYKFWIEGAVSDLPEAIVPWPLLVRLAGSVGLEPVLNDNFHALFQRFTSPSSDPLYRHLLKVMKVMEEGGTLTQDEWELCGVYRAFVFRLRKDPVVRLPRDIGCLQHLPPGFHVKPRCFYRKDCVREDILDLIQHPYPKDAEVPKVAPSASVSGGIPALAMPALSTPVVAPATAPRQPAGPVSLQTPLQANVSTAATTETDRKSEEARPTAPSQPPSAPLSQPLVQSNATETAAAPAPGAAEGLEEEEGDFYDVGFDDDEMEEFG